MKVYIMAILLVVLAACKHTNNTKENIEEHSQAILNRALEREIKEIIRIKKEKISSRNHKLKVCNVIVYQGYELNDSCLIRISLDEGFFRVVEKFVPPTEDLLPSPTSQNKDVIGFTLLENELVAFYISPNQYSNVFVNEEKLFPLKDSIFGYPNPLFPTYNPNIIDDSPPIRRIYKIISADSLLLVNSNIF